MLLACAGTAPFASSEIASAQSPSAEQDFSIPAGSLNGALQAFSAQTNIQLVYSSDLVTGKSSPGVNARMARGEALAALLSGTGLTGSLSGNTATIRAAGADGELVTGAVRVEGAEGSPYFGGAGQMAGVNGVNGSRDITATEGTKSFTSGALAIGSKVPQAMKDIPQSLSVLTNERLEQQNVTGFDGAMKQLPGVILVQGGSSLENTFYSRGFAISSIQVDGGAPLSTSFGYQPQIDMAQYDHVELLRGAAGQFGSYGEPGGTVNLVRKKPLDHAQFALEMQAGSWRNYRAVIDATGPLALDGRLRGRVVMTYKANHFFYDTAKDRKTLLYGIAEFDATPTTLLTAGISYTKQNSVPWQYGLPRYQTGADLKLPRSTCLCFDWNRWDFDTTEIFGGIEQKIGSDWNFRLNLTQNRQSDTQKVGFSYGGVNPANGAGPYLRGLYHDFSSKQLSAEATLSGAFLLFGQRQEVTIGVNRSNTDGGGEKSYDGLISTSFNPYQPYPGGPVYCQDYGSGTCPAGSIAANGPPIDVFHFDPNNPLYSEPPNSLPNTLYNEYGQVQSGAYINLRLTAFDRLHLTTGLHWSRYKSKFAFEGICTTIPPIDPGYSPSCFGKSVGDVYQTFSAPYNDQDFSWPPPVNVSFDITRHLTVYAGYTDIYRSQANTVSADRKPLPPITGANVEAGLKWAARDGKLNVNLSAYRIKQKGFATIDPPDYSGYYEVSPGVTCCYIADPNKTYLSEGVDIEATGELRPGWQIAASYTYNYNEQKGSTFGSDNGKSFVSISPKNLYKLWMSYDLGAAGMIGPLSRLSVSGGINGQSSAFQSGYVCVNFDPLTPPDLTGYQPCKSNSDPDYVQYSFTVPPYILVSARIDYRLSDRWSLAVNLENILDRKYYQTVGAYTDSGHWYGAPRSLTATLRAKW